jgi:hypothetical protein
MTIGSATGERLPALSEVTDAQWEALARRQIFFGHQSVGSNILEGVAELMAENPAIRLSIVESRELAGAPALRHAYVGRNDHPLEKFADFAAVMRPGFGAEGGLAMVKLCYTDVHTDTDPVALFADYRRRMDAQREANPGVTIVHFTMPLTAIENWKGRLRAALTGMHTQRARNAIRHRYNELVREAYAGREPLFDIARLESTLPDGSRVTYRHGGADVPLLAPQYTDDGGHLNAVARRRVAEQFLVTLAGLAPRAAPQRRS